MPRVILFQDRFAGLVRQGQKRQTIRKKARCKPGDLLSLRRWTGGAYRSKQEALCANVVCADVLPVSIGHDGISVGGLECDAAAREALARADGFGCADELLEWFGRVHGLPFAGELVSWHLP